MKRWPFLFLVLSGLIVLSSCTKNESEQVELQTLSDLPQARFGETPNCEECVTPGFIELREIERRSAELHWAAADSPDPDPDCGGYYLITLFNLNTGATRDFAGWSSPFQFDNLMPCTEYEVRISYVNEFCASAPAKTTFTTDCHCDIESILPFQAYFANVRIGEKEFELNEPYVDYLNSTNQVATFSPGQPLIINTQVFLTIPPPTPWIIKLWVDFDQNGSFTDPGEFVHFQQLVAVLPGLFDITLGPINFPNVTACKLTARMVLSPDPNAGPCGTFAIGQTVDFTFNSADNCGLDPI